MHQAIDDLLSRAVDSGDVPGVVALVTSRDRLLYEGAFGVRVLGEDAPMSADTVCRIASMTKAITGAAAMQLLEQGRLALDRPAAEWCPELASIPILEGFDADGTPRLRAARNPITLRQLLTHTAGFGYETWNADLFRYQQLTGLPMVGSGKKAALRMPLVFEPGTRWLYSIGIDWVGQVIEAASGMTLGAYFAAHLFEPLGMTSTAHQPTPEMLSRLALVHQRDASGALTPQAPAFPKDPEFEGGGGGLYGSAADYLRFVRMILNRGRSGDAALLKPETVDLMSRNAIGELRVTRLETQLPERSNDAEFFPGVPKSWGLSFQINEAPAPTGRPAGGLMWAGLANTYFWIDPVNGIGGVFFTQILPFADVKAFPLFTAFEKAVYDAR